MGKLSRFLLALAFVLLPGSVFALSGAPPISGTVTIANSSLDSVSTTTSDPSDANGDILGYVLNFHDSKYQYSVPICSNSTLEEVNGNSIDPSAFVAGDELTITVSPGQSTGVECISKVVRQVISRGPTQGQCLQNYQVTHAIDGNPKKLEPHTPYTYSLTVYARPTFDCDGKAYGSAAITTKVAAGQPFNVTLSQGSNQLTSWTVTTDPTGKATLSYTFPESGSYTFAVEPASDLTPGDVIYWNATPGQTGGGTPTPSPKPVDPSKLALDPVPFVVFVIVVLLAVGAAEFWHWRIKRRRATELPEDEYMRTPKL